MQEAIFILVLVALDAVKHLSVELQQWRLDQQYTGELCCEDVVVSLEQDSPSEKYFSLDYDGDFVEYLSWGVGHGAT